MPILVYETYLYPDTLLSSDDSSESDFEAEAQWWVFYTRSRREKELMRRLKANEIAYYAPIIAKRTKSPQGRIRTSYVPLFPSYVFIYGDNTARHTALATNCISRTIEVQDGDQLKRDLGQIQRLIETNVPLAPESRLEAGKRIRVRSGAFVGQEGVVIRRQGKQRLLIAITLLQQGVSVQIEDCDVESLD